jgi:hypothetical protein
MYECMKRVRMYESRTGTMYVTVPVSLETVRSYVLSTARNRSQGYEESSMTRLDSKLDRKCSHCNGAEGGCDSCPDIPMIEDLTAELKLLMQEIDQQTQHQALPSVDQLQRWARLLASMVRCGEFLGELERKDFEEFMAREKWWRDTLAAARSGRDEPPSMAH